MDQLSWIPDVNPLTDLFRQAYREFSDLLDPVRLPPSGTQVVSASNALKAAREMQTALIDITTTLGRNASWRQAATRLEPAKALQYAFVALVDETLLNTSWQGKDPWIDCLLEESMFHTRMSGVELFERIKDAMQTRSQQSLEIAVVYLHCLNLDFRGKYRGTEQWLEITIRCRKDLFFYIYQYTPDLTRESCVLSELAELNLIKTEPGQRRLADKVRWYLYVFGILALPFCMSCFLWWHMSSPLRAVIE